MVVKAFRAYKITHIDSGKAYIGVTTRTLAHRWSRHKTAAKTRGSALAGAIIKYGADRFSIEHIANATCMDDLLDLERMLIAQERTKAPFGYNLTAGGEGAFDPAESTRAKIGAIHRGRRRSPETVEKIRAALLARAPMSEATRLKHQESTWKKTSETNRSRQWTDESREKVRRAMVGKPRSAASLAKQSATMMGRPVSDEARKKIAEKARARYAAQAHGAQSRQLELL